jgi:hypothetical protein
MPAESKPTAAWSISGDCAVLAKRRFRAAVNLGRPDLGLDEIEVGDNPLTGCRLLGLDAPQPPDAAARPLVELYARGADLVAVYGPSRGWPVRVDALWRVLEPTGPAGEELFLAGVELVVSVRTEMLDTEPALSVQAAVPAGRILRLVDPRNGHFQACAPTATGPALLTPGDGSGCLLFSAVSEKMSYVEMVHPADFCRSRLAIGDRGAAAQVSHRLFAERLEKGVILRARVRGLFLRPAGDAQRAAECYAAFAQAEPPLGS